MLDKERFLVSQETDVIERGCFSVIYQQKPMLEKWVVFMYQKKPMLEKGMAHIYQKKPILEKRIVFIYR